VNTEFVIRHVEQVDLFTGFADKSGSDDVGQSDPGHAGIVVPGN